MPQIHTKEQEAYKEISTWIKQDIMTKYSDVTILMGGDLQATPWEVDTRSHYAPLRQFCEKSGLNLTTPTDTHTFIPAKKYIDHWIL